MLSLSEFNVCALSDAKPLSIMIPRSKGGRTFVVGGGDDIPFAVCLEGDAAWMFKAVNLSDHSSFNGILIGDISLEVDETSVFDTMRKEARIGSIVRKSNALYIATASQNWAGDSELRTLITGLPMLSERCEVGFYAWQLVLGAGTEKRVLKAINVTPSSET